MTDDFKNSVEKRFDKIDDRFDKVDGKLDALFAFKWQIVGGSALAGGILSLVVTVIVEVIKAH